MLGVDQLAVDRIMFTNRPVCALHLLIACPAELAEEQLKADKLLTVTRRQLVHVVFDMHRGLLSLLVLKRPNPNFANRPNSGSSKQIGCLGSKDC